MRPRQNLRDFHHNTPPPTSQPPTYQSVNHSVALQPPLQSMAPPPLLPSPMSAGSQAGQSSQPPTLPMPDLFAELSRLGLNPEDMNNQSFNRPHLPDEVLKNLQAILGKRDSADLLRKLLPSHNDPSNTSAPDYQRLIGGNSGTSSGGNMDNILSGTILSGTGGCTGGALSFTNNINNGNSSQQQEQQDVQYASAQQQQHQAAASTVNHHQHFRIPTTNTAMHNSPLQQQQQQQQLLSQHKSVLSLHHPQQHLTHPHQNDPANRQRLNQQHKLNSAPNSSIANLNDMSGGPSSSSLSSSNAALLDTKNSNIFNHRTSPAINSYTIPSAGTTSRVPNIMDALGGQPGLDNMNDNMPFQQAITMNNRDKLKSLAKHQQLQKQFRTTADKHKNLQWPNQNVSSANLNLGSDPLNQQRIIGSNINNNSNVNNISMSQLQRQMNSPLSSAISPPQASPGLPKSLLNLAACSTSPPNAGNVNSLASNSRISNQLSNVRGSNVNIGNNVNSTNNRQIVRNNTNSVGQRATSSADPNNILQQIMTRPSNNKNPGSNSATRSGYSNFSLSSLLSDDQSSNLKDNNNSTNNNNNNRSVVNQNTVPILRPNSQGSQPVQRRPSSAKSDDSYPLQVNANPKDAYIAYLQDRATKGVNIGDITCSTSSHVLDQPSQLQNVLMAQPEADEPTDEYQGHIEPALNRVEARNDLSLLYPPVSLASNSQKQINSLSAGIKLPEEVDLFTDEVKKIVQEDCNIIYECKTCSNLFRSLANLVKHKRLYCKENSNNAAQLELNRRSTMNTIQTLDMSVTKNSRESVISRPVINKDHEESKNSLLVDSRPRQSVVPPVSNGSQKYNLRGKRVDVSCLTGDSRASRAARNQDKLRDNRGQGSPNSSRNYPDNLNPNSGQTNLSRLLQSQPKNRVGAMKDSALMDALNIGPALSVGDGRNIVGNTSICKLNEQLVRNSSLAKTLLSENVKSINESQPNFEIPNADSNTVTGQKPITTPKRKFLEDCIRKVKRDKLVPDDGCGPDSTPIENQEAPEAISHDESDQYRDPLDIDDSGADSDVLVMDIDESYLPPNRKKASNEKISPNRSQTRSATSFLQATSRLNSSSALLKALTRPVEPKPTYPTSSNQKIEVDKHSQSSNSVDDRATATDDRATTTDDVKSDNSTGNLPDKVENAEEVEKQDDQPPEEPVTQPLSPIMDKFSCESCSTEYPDHQTLFEHIINDHKTLKKIHPCIFCSLSFITLENVCRHIIDIHKKTKTQVGRLKDVVESRSFYSSDFTACTDLPASCKDEEKDRTETDRTKNVTPEALSDLAATEQILNDTVALVSMASSPNKAATTMSPWERPETSSTSNTSSVSGSLIESSSSDGTDSDSDSSDTNNSQRADVDDDNEIEANDQIEECDSKADDDYEEEAGDDPLTICVTPTKRKTSSCGSASKRETDLNSSEIGDKISKQEYNDDASPHISSKSSSRSSVANTPDGSGSCKLKLKTASLSSSSSSREVGGANSGASTSSGGAPTSGSGSSGIMKLKIQLKTQPDEKSKVYRIVE